MKDLAVLTPPFLMAAAVITAIVLFLRHEMSRGRAQRPDPDAENPPADSVQAGEQDTKAANHGERDGARAAAPAKDR